MGERRLHRPGETLYSACESATERMRTAAADAELPEVASPLAPAWRAVVPRPGVS